MRVFHDCMDHLYLSARGHPLDKQTISRKGAFACKSNGAIAQKEERMSGAIPQKRHCLTFFVRPWGYERKKTWLKLIGPCCFTLWVKYCLSLYTKLLQLTGVVRITPLEVSCDVLSWGWKHAEKMTVKPRFKIFKLFKERSPKLFLKIFVFFKFSALVIFLASLKLADICCQFFLDCCSQKTFWRAGSCSVA